MTVINRPEDCIHQNKFVILKFKLNADGVVAVLFPRDHCQWKHCTLISIYSHIHLHLVLSDPQLKVLNQRTTKCMYHDWSDILVTHPSACITHHRSDDTLIRFFYHMTSMMGCRIRFNSRPPTAHASCHLIFHVFIKPYHVLCISCPFMLYISCPFLFQYFSCSMTFHFEYLLTFHVSCFFYVHFSCIFFMFVFHVYF